MPPVSMATSGPKATRDDAAKSGACDYDTADFIQTFTNETDTDRIISGLSVSVDKPRLLLHFGISRHIFYSRPFLDGKT